MKLLDKHILFHFLVALAFALVGFIVIFVLVDVIDNMDKFLDRKVPAAIVLTYYLYFLPTIVNTVLPIAMLLAALFSMGTLANNNELLAMRSAGVSLYRALWPIWIVSVLVAIGAFGIEEYVLPQANHERNAIAQDKISKSGPNRDAPLPNFYYYGNRGMVYYFRSYTPIKQEARGVIIQEIVGDHVKRRWDAPVMYRADSIWKLNMVQVRTFGQGDSMSYVKLPVTDLPTVDETPEDFMQKQQSPDEMSVPRLTKHIERMRAAGMDVHEERVAWHVKFSYPFATLVVVLFGAPFSARQRRTHAALGFGVALAICYSYYVLMRFGQVLGTNGYMDPFWAAWTGNILFGILGIWSLVRSSK